MCVFPCFLIVNSQKSKVFHVAMFMRRRRRNPHGFIHELGKAALGLGASSWGFRVLYSLSVNGFGAEAIATSLLIRCRTPSSIIEESDFIDDFASSKRNMFSQISGWLLSEKREDKIDDFVQEMEMNAFWSMDRREAIAKNILKNLDFKNTFCCEMKFDTAEELAEHSHQCIFRSIDCSNEGCRARFSAVHMEKHDSFCPFKVLPCEQKCSENILRCEMDRHCITVCPMKLANCPFHHLGCQSIIPHCAIEEHCTVSLHSHLLYVLRVIHKQASAEDLNHWVEVLEKSLSPSQAQDARSLTFAVRDLEAHMGPLEHNPRSVSDN
ncbi:uncharacterized protein LOC122083382 isoform X2 [Macadamia integrifolia]|uniref:uncharacterized protein LOC122083382 isoform X2 n=1 Tax=Macadamia integrifolia TaxID=60698 RepID=UPI001C4EC254|nr:uncharacterized protein LOC122083382 isoform X2 [Macadamia integrifolia]